MGTQKSAREKFCWIKDIIEKAREGSISLEEDKVIADFCIYFSSTIRTARDIIKVFAMRGDIIRAGGIITINQNEAPQ